MPEQTTGEWFVARATNERAIHNCSSETYGGRKCSCWAACGREGQHGAKLRARDWRRPPAPRSCCAPFGPWLEVMSDGSQQERGRVQGGDFSSPELHRFLNEVIRFSPREAQNCAAHQLLMDGCLFAFLDVIGLHPDRGPSLEVFGQRGHRHREDGQIRLLLSTLSTRA